MFEDAKQAQLEQELRSYGEKSLPIMEALPNKLSDLISAMLCTPEGFNVCAIGFKNDDIAKMAAVSSSLYAMAKSVVKAFSGAKDNQIDTITIHSKEMDILGRKIAISDGKSLILIIASNKTTTGLQLYAAEYVEKQLQQVL